MINRACGRCGWYGTVGGCVQEEGASRTSEGQSCVAVACIRVGRLGLHEALVDVGRGELVGALPVVGVVLELLDVPPNDDDNVCVIGPLAHAQIEIIQIETHRDERGSRAQ